MIPVTPAKEPDVFNAGARQPGQKWLADNGIDASKPPPKPSALPAYWQRASRELWDAYNGVCAYLCIFFDFPLGAHSTEHFVAKSRMAGLAYEWSNYRLSCLGANRRKNRFDDVLDPFEIEPDTFVLNLASGEIKPNSDKPPHIQKKAQTTIERLGLDDPEMNNMRARHYEDLLRDDISATYLQSHSPFVWYEAQKQGLL